MMRTHRRIAMIFLGAALVAACSRAANGPAGPIAIKVDERGFTPTEVTVKSGEKTQLVFTRTSDRTCAKDVVFPDLKIEKKLPLNESVTVDVPTDKTRTLAFQCGMGMLFGKVVVQ